MSGMDWSAQSGSGPASYEEFLVPAMFAPFADPLLEHAGVAEGSHVLDLACGTGVVSRAAARRTTSTGSVTAVDIGAATLEFARSRPAEEGAALITYVQSDAGALPLADQIFDVALCQQGLQFFPDRPAALAELRRVLKPRGVLAIATWTDFAHSPMIAIADALEHHLGPEATQMMHSPWSLSDPAELQRLLSDSGLHEVEVFAETIICTWASHPEFAIRALAATPLASLFDDATQEGREAVIEEVRTRLAPHALPDGRLRMAMTANVALARA